MKDDLIKEKKIIKSLHRPFNTRLITCKWVCDFAKNYNGINFKNDFFLYFIQFLYNHYLNEDKNIYGLPAKDTVTLLYNYIETNENIKDDIERFNNPNKKNSTDIDKKLFSNLKAVLYYITLSKNLGLIGLKSSLTEDGFILSSMRSSSKHFMQLTSKEQIFLANQIFINDFIPIIFSVHYYRLKKKYNPTDKELEEINNRFLKTLDNFLKIREFNYKQSSWKNYLIVRERWIEDLELLSQSSNNLKPTYFKMIKLNEDRLIIYENINNIMLTFEKDLFKTLSRYREFKVNLYNTYKVIQGDKLFDNIGYVNLYAIKKNLKTSFNELELMLNRLNKDDNNRRKIFFNNIISAIDSRKRFKINNTPVLNIRITKALK